MASIRETLMSFHHKKSRNNVPGNTMSKILYDTKPANLNRLLGKTDKRLGAG
jgi:hypothetical protein